MSDSVVVVGAGPVGLMLAAELRLGGVGGSVLERRLARSGESRGVGFTARATEILQLRGLLRRFGDVEITRQGHFGGIPLDFGILAGSHFGVRGVSQERVEEMLEERALELGARVLRGYEVVDLRFDANWVTVTADGPVGRTEFTARYLVGCDGGHSRIRKLAGFEFVGTDAVREMYLADVVGAELRPRPIGERVAGGMVMCGPLGPGVDRIIVCPTEQPPSEARRSVEFAEVAEQWERLTGESLAGAHSTWVSAFTDATRQVTEYRRGPVLLAGDAAHIHLPAGGQGMSLGIQDATNLGWKLAATCNGWAPADLLDTYHSERHPVGERVLRNTRAQGSLYLSGADIEPLRRVTAELMTDPDVGRHLSGMVSGLDVRYEVEQTGHPSLGMRLADGAVVLSGGRRVQAYELFHQGRGVLISTAGEHCLQLASGWQDRVDLIAADALPGQWQLPGRSLLVRPDGYLVWLDLGDDSGAGFDGDPTAALTRWFGPGRTLVAERSGPAATTSDHHFEQGR